MSQNPDIKFHKIRKSQGCDFLKLCDLSPLFSFEIMPYNYLIINIIAYNIRGMLGYIKSQY